MNKSNTLMEKEKTVCCYLWLLQVCIEPMMANLPVYMPICVHSACALVAHGQNLPQD